MNTCFLFNYFKYLHIAFYLKYNSLQSFSRSGFSHVDLPPSKSNRNRLLHECPTVYIGSGCLRGQRLSNMQLHHHLSQTKTAEHNHSCQTHLSSYNQQWQLFIPKGGDLMKSPVNLHLPVMLLHLRGDPHTQLLHRKARLLSSASLVTANLTVHFRVFIENGRLMELPSLLRSKLHLIPKKIKNKKESKKGLF